MISQKVVSIHDFIVEHNKWLKPWNTSTYSVPLKFQKWKKWWKPAKLIYPQKKRHQLTSATEVKKQKTNLVSSLDNQISGADLWTMENSTL